MAASPNKLNLVPAIREVEAQINALEREFKAKIKPYHDSLASLRKINEVCEKCNGRGKVLRSRSCAEDDGPDPNDPRETIRRSDFMSRAFIVLLMIFFHIVDDYYLQGWLASAKQKQWWEENAPQKLYRYDYIWALLMHSFSWAFMIMLPIAAVMSFDVGVYFLAWFFFNVFVHAFTDDMKANSKLINLWQDQAVHMGQIAATAYFLLWF